MTIENLPEMMSVRQTADFLGVCMQTIYRRIRVGELPGARLGNRTIRIKKRELFAALGLKNESAVLAGTAAGQV